MITPADIGILEHLENIPGLTAELAFLLSVYPSVAAAGRGLRRLERARMVHGADYIVRSVQIAGPLHREPEDGEVNANELERTIRNRYGAPKSERVFSLGAFRRPSQVDHELGVARAYVWFQEHRAPHGWRWIAERPRRGGLVADAFFQNPEGELIAMDFCGEYRANKVSRISSFWSARGTPLELF